MAQFSVNATRFDPYKNFKFRVRWDGRYVAGVSKVGALKRSTDLVEHRKDSAFAKCRDLADPQSIIRLVTPASTSWSCLEGSSIRRRRFRLHRRMSSSVWKTWRAGIFGQLSTRSHMRSR